MDIYAIVTDKIINLLEQGVVPWRRPWASTGPPRNLMSKKPYRGINHFLLSASKCVSPFWLTMRRANELGGHVRKGEESTIVVFWKVEDATHSTEDLDNEAKVRRRFLLRYYRVFNLEQCELPQTVLAVSVSGRISMTLIVIDHQQVVNDCLCLTGVSVYREARCVRAVSVLREQVADS